MFTFNTKKIKKKNYKRKGDFFDRRIFIEQQKDVTKKCFSIVKFFNEKLS